MVKGLARRDKVSELQDQVLISICKNKLYTIYYIFQYFNILYILYTIATIYCSYLLSKFSIALFSQALRVQRVGRASSGFMVALSTSKMVPPFVLEQERPNQRKHRSQSL